MSSENSHDRNVALSDEQVEMVWEIKANILYTDSFNALYRFRQKKRQS